MSYSERKVAVKEDFELFHISMLRQKVFLDIAIPCAWDKLLNDTFCGEMCEGELLVSLTEILSCSPQERRFSLYKALIGQIKQQIKVHKWADDKDRVNYEKSMEDLALLFVVPL